MAGVLQDLFSDAVRAVERRGLEMDESLLWPEEEAHLGSVAPGRRRDFVNGRWCARRAIADLGQRPEPILAGSDRQPLWPEGLVGSITHTSGYVAAAVASAAEVATLGIDAEPDEPLPDKVLGRIGFDAELDWIREVDPGMGVANPDRLLFSTKEAVYKAWHPLTGAWLGFSEARIEIDAGRGAFEATIGVEGPVRRMVGRYRSMDGVIITAIEVSPLSIAETGNGIARS